MKKIISLGLAFLLTLSCCTMATARGTGEIIDEEIQIRYETAIADIYLQLEQQGALDMLDVYEDIVYSMIKGQVNAEFGIMPMEEATGFYAPNGGTVGFMQPRGNGWAPTPVVITCLTKAQAEDIVMDVRESVTNPFFNTFSLDTIYNIVKKTPKFQKFVQKIASSNPGVVPAANILSAMKDFISLCNQRQYSSIQAANNCVMIIETYYYADGHIATGILGWSTKPTIFMPEGMYATEGDFTSF